MTLASGADAAAKRPPTSPATMALLMCVTLTGTLPIHLLVPVLPLIQADFGIEPAQVQAAVTVYLTGLAVGQLVLGPLSDRFGRRPVLLAGMGLYVAGTLVTALAPNLAILLIARAAQGLGGCAGLALGRAMVRDVSNDDAVTRNLAFLSTAMSLSPGLSPVVATLAAPIVGWRAMLIGLAAAATLLLALCAVALPETRRGETARLKTHLAQYGRLLTNGHFLRTCVGGACATTGLYAFIANAAYILHGRFAIPLARSGPLYFSIMISITMGGISAASLGRRLGGKHVLIVTSSLMLMAAACSLGLSLPGVHRFGLYLAAIMFFAFLVGLSSPVAMGRALAAMPQATGAASGVYGSMQMAIGALLVMALGWVPGTPEFATGTVLSLAAFVAILCFSKSRRLDENTRGPKFQYLRAKGLTGEGQKDAKL